MTHDDVSAEVRVCGECNLPKSVSDYYAHYKRVCRVCISARSKRRYQEKRDALIDYAKQWRSQQPPEYVTWTDMKQRCENPRNKEYANYGGRGITACPEWRKDFHRFLADMGPRPGPKYTLERKDINGPYCLSNCRWASNNEQQNNKRTNVISYLCGPDGPTYSAAELGRSMGMSPRHLRSLDLQWHRDGKPIPPLPYRTKRGPASS